MSNTPNPRRRPLRKSTSVIEMFRLQRADEDVLVPGRGRLPVAAYEQLRADNPTLALPALAAIPWAA